MIKVQSNTATREPIPRFLRGLSRESLADLSWTDPALGVSDAAWWPVEDQSPPLGEYERYGAETLTVDTDRKVVVSVREVVPFSEEEIEEIRNQVNAERRAGILEERARRIAMGFEYDFGDERGVHYIQTRPADEEGWKQADRWASAMTGLGDTESTLLINTSRGPVQVTAPEWHAIVAHGASVQQPIWQASFVLRAMDPVPEDYADDKWWP